jgi:hypothetical protein
MTTPKNQIEYQGAAIRYINSKKKMVHLEKLGPALMEIKESLIGLAYALEYPLRQTGIGATIGQQYFMGHIVTAMRDMCKKIDKIYPDFGTYYVTPPPPEGDDPAAGPGEAG